MDPSEIYRRARTVPLRNRQSQTSERAGEDTLDRQLSTDGLRIHTITSTSEVSSESSSADRIRTPSQSPDSFKANVASFIGNTSDDQMLPGQQMSIFEEGSGSQRQQSPLVPLIRTARHNILTGFLNELGMNDDGLSGAAPEDGDGSKTTTTLMRKQTAGKGKLQQSKQLPHQN